MSTLLFTHPACLDHDAGEYHPERPARLRAILQALEAEEFANLARAEAPQASEAHILLAHTADHFALVRQAIPRSGIAHLDPDTAVSHGSWDAILRAAGGVVAAVDAVAAGQARNAFCAVRPPGHHAEPQHPMGFCLFNNVAIGAQRARIQHKLERVAIVDFDVHHGNGTQAMFEEDPHVFFASTHQFPLYPGTGSTGERGVGNVFNAPLRPGSGSAEFRQAMSGTILPALENFKPQLILVSAGFDAHRDDPLANLNLEEADYAWVTERLLEAAGRHAQGRLVSTLEGGYNLDALAASAEAHVAALLAA